MQLLITLCNYCNTISKDNGSNIYLPIITAILSSGVTYYIATTVNRKTELNSLTDQLDSILKSALQYPYFELEEFANNWDKSKLKSPDKEEAEKYQRYDIYMNLVFNYMERLAQYHDYDGVKILNHVDIKSWVKTHQKIWYNPASENEQRDGFTPKLRRLLDKFIKN